MATILPIAYNTGSTISGTEQIGDLAIGTTSQDYSSNIGGVKWWASPDLDLQYVIGYVDLSGTHPNPISFTPCYIGFWGCGNKTENSFIDLCNFQFNQNFTSGNDAKVWLNGNGYWTNFGMGTTPLPTATPTLTPAPTSTPTALPATSTPAPTDTPTPTPTETPIGATSTPTPIPHIQIINTNTTRSVTSLQLTGNTVTLDGGSYPILNGVGYKMDGVTATAGSISLNFGGSGFFTTFRIYVNDVEVYNLDGYASSTMVMGGTSLTTSDYLRIQLS